MGAFVKDNWPRFGWGAYFSGAIYWVVAGIAAAVVGDVGKIGFLWPMGIVGVAMHIIGATVGLVHLAAAEATGKWKWRQASDSVLARTGWGVLALLCILVGFSLSVLVTVAAWFFVFEIADLIPPSGDVFLQIVMVGLVFVPVLVVILVVGWRRAFVMRREYARQTWMEAHVQASSPAV